MSDFQVDPDDLTAFGTQLSGYAQKAEDVNQYVLDHEADDTADKYGTTGWSNSTSQAISDTVAEVSGQGVCSWFSGRLCAR
jgi:hypothetical protein